VSSIESQTSVVSKPESVVSSPGAQLRQARERRGETVSEVAFALKLSPRQIVALESDDFAGLPGMAFVRGFLRNYARYLGLDPAPLLDGVQRLAGEGAVDLSPIRNADGELPSGSGPRVGTAPIGWIVLVLVLLLLGGWYFDGFRTEPPVAETVIEAPMVGNVAVEPVPAAVPPTPDSSVPLGAGPAVSAPLPAAVPAQQPDVVSPSVPPAPTTAEVSAAPVEAEMAGAIAAPVAESSPMGVASGQLAFRFAGESWVEVRDASGAIVYSGVNRAGTTRNVQGKAPFALVIGNAANVSLEFGGKPVPLATHTKVTVARLTVQ